jgi:four helix bundle suffix protein
VTLFPYTTLFRSPQWRSDGPEASEVRAVPRTFRKDPSDQSDLTDLSDQERWALYARWLDHADPAIRANATICLIHQANFLLDRQIAALETAFVQDGGYSEQLATERLRHRKKDQSDPTNPSNPTDLQPPNCPSCGALMALRTAKSGKTPGSQFWGCTKYPDCKGTAKI